MSSLGEHSLDFHNILEGYLKSHPAVKLAFQPGTFQMKLGWEKLKYFYERSDIFFCNIQEAQRILGTTDEDIKKLLHFVNRIGPKTVVITDGPQGAYALHEGISWSMAIYPDPKPPFERTGAGDAFSSTFAVALALGLSIEDALKWAPINAMAVVQKIGAREGLLTRRELEEFLKKAPIGYRPKPI